MSQSPPSAMDLAPPLPENATPAMCIALWRDVMDTSEQLLLAGLRREIGPEGDLKAAYRQWYESHMREHDQMLYHLMEELSRRGGDDGG
jgi:hypothetical protein